MQGWDQNDLYNMEGWDQSDPWLPNGNHGHCERGLIYIQTSGWPQGQWLIVDICFLGRDDLFFSDIMKTMYLNDKISGECQFWL